jgi:hypothetical protein
MTLTRPISAAALLAAALLYGCAGTVKHMQEVPGNPAVGPDPGKALVVFMRPSGLGFAIQSSVFEATGDEPRLVGIVAAKTKVAYQATPGKHLFMVVSEAADFMSAELQAGKTYYALVTPRMGAWRARFSLKAVSRQETGSSEFAGWKSDTRLVENTPASNAWARDNIADVKSKQTRYYSEWMKKPEAERPRLAASDGT